MTPNDRKESKHPDAEREMRERLQAVEDMVWEKQRRIDREKEQGEEPEWNRP